MQEHEQYEHHPANVNTIIAGKNSKSIIQTQNFFLEESPEKQCVRFSIKSILIELCRPPKQNDKQIPASQSTKIIYLRHTRWNLQEKQRELLPQLAKNMATSHFNNHYHIVTQVVNSFISRKQSDNNLKQSLGKQATSQHIKATINLQNMMATF